MYDVVDYFEIIGRETRWIIAYAYTLESGQRHKYIMTPAHIAKSSRWFRERFIGYYVMHTYNYSEFIDMYDTQCDVKTEWNSDIKSIRRHLT